MTKLARVLALLFLAVVSLPAQAKAPETEQDRLIREVLALSGMKKSLDQIPSYVKPAVQAASRQATNLSPDDLKALEKIFQKTMTPKVLYKDVQDYLKRNYDGELFANFVETAHAPLARQTTELETQKIVAEDMAKFNAQLQTNPPSDERMALIGKIDQLGRVTETALDMQVAVVRGLVSGITRALPAEAQVTDEQLGLILDKAKSQARENYETQIQIYMLYVYRSMTDDELNEYISLLETDAVRRSSVLLAAAYSQAMGNAATSAGDQMAKWLDAKKAKMVKQAKRSKRAPVMIMTAPQIIVSEPPPVVKQYKYNDLITAVMMGDQEATVELLEDGRDINRPSDTGFTPLIAAIMNGNVEMVKLLVASGADVRLKSHGKAPLDYARKETEMVQLLSQAGAVSGAQ